MSLQTVFMAGELFGFRKAILMLIEALTCHLFERTHTGLLHLAFSR